MSKILAPVPSSPLRYYQHIQLQAANHRQQLPSGVTSDQTKHLGRCNWQTGTHEGPLYYELLFPFTCMLAYKFDVFFVLSHIFHQLSFALPILSSISSFPHQHYQGLTKSSSCCWSHVYCPLYQHLLWLCTWSFRTKCVFAPVCAMHNHCTTGSSADIKGLAKLQSLSS